MKKETMATGGDAPTKPAKPAKATQPVSQTKKK